MDALSTNLNGYRQGFSTIMVDPPWPERGGGRIKRGADRHYSLMSVADISRLAVNYAADRNCCLWLWTTNTYLPDALRIMSTWDFRYINNIAWGKVKDGKVQLGIGQYFRGSHELLLFGVRGSPGLPDRSGLPGALFSTLQLHPRGEHSRKPEAIVRSVEAISSGPYLELFARSARPGWTCVGNEDVQPGESDGVYIKTDVGLFLADFPQGKLL